jgi:hypothetical protein
VTRRTVVLAYDVQRLSEFDDEEYEQIGRVRDVTRETEKALLVKVPDWGVEVWFPRWRVRLDDDDVLWVDRTMFEIKKRERV